MYDRSNNIYSRVETNLIGEVGVLNLREKRLNGSTGMATDDGNLSASLHGIPTLVLSNEDFRSAKIQSGNTVELLGVVGVGLEIDRLSM